MNFEPDSLLRYFPALYMIRDRFPYMMEPHKNDIHNSQLFVYDFGCRLAYRVISRRCEPVMAVGNKFIPQASPIYYYEVYMEDLGTGGHIQIGYIGENVKGRGLLSREESIGVSVHFKHFTNTDSSQKLIPITCISGDTIGIGVNYVKKSYFITKNGVLMNTESFNISIMKLRPAVSLSSAGAQFFVNLGSRPYCFHLSEIVDPIYTTFNKKLLNPIDSYKVSGATETINVIFQYMNHHCFTKTAKEIVKYVNDSSKSKIENLDFNKEIYEHVFNKDFISVYDKIVKFYPDIQTRSQAVYLSLLCAKYYNIASSLNNLKFQENKESKKSLNKDLAELVSLARRILQCFREYDNTLYLDSQLVDDCGMMKSEWQSFIKELLSLMCFSENEYFTRFDYLYDFRAKIWNGLSKILNNESSILESMPTQIVCNFEKKMLDGEVSAAVGLSYAISLFEGKSGLKFT